MARSLPENTVDAWTSIGLAKHGAKYIWLPTTNQGATAGGYHPGDVSTVAGRRLIVIENKGIEDESHIHLGTNWQIQHRYLRRVEEVGIALLRDPSMVPPLGWVFYGLPALAGSVDGTMFGTFPASHLLVCPHEVGAWPGLPSVGLHELSEVLRRPCDRGLHPGPGSPAALPVRHLTLATLMSASVQKAAGLPFPADPGMALDMLRDLVWRTRTAVIEADLDVDPGQFTSDGVDAHALLRALGRMISVGSTAPTMALGWGGS